MDLIAAAAQQCKHAIRFTDVRSPGNDEIGLTTRDIALDFLESNCGCARQVAVLGKKEYRATAARWVVAPKHNVLRPGAISSRQQLSSEEDVVTGHNDLRTMVA